MVGPTGVSRRVSGVHLDAIVTHQSPVGVIHALYRSRQDVERDGVLVRRDRSGFQLSAPGIRKGDGTGRRGRGIRDDFTERGERQVGFRGERPDELSVDGHHFSNRAEKGIWVGDDRQGGGLMIYLSVAIRWLMTAHASSGRAFLITGIQSQLSGDEYLLTI